MGNYRTFTMAIDLYNTELPPKFKVVQHTHTHIKDVQHHVKIKMWITFNEFL